MRKYVYISDEQLEEAEKRGIPREIVKQRLNAPGAKWDIDSATTTPVRGYKKNKKWLAIAEENGITANSFYIRIYKGMTPQEAATTPKYDRSKHNIWGTIRQRKYSEELVAKAAENGVSYYVLRDRIVNGMDESIACMKIEDIKGKFTDEKIEVGDTVKVVGLGNSNVLYLVTFISVSGVVTLQKYGFKRKRHVQYKHLRHFEIVKQDQN